jgi:hypothetical protein
MEAARARGETCEAYARRRTGGIEYMIKHAVVALSLVIVPAAFAQTYIVPDGDCGAITLHATRGRDFPHLGEEIATDQVQAAYVHAARKRQSVTPESGTLDFTANVPEGEVVMASVELKPEVRGNETIIEHAKAMVFCGAQTPVADWQRSTGLGFEVFPQAWNGPRPRMKAGDRITFIAVDVPSKKILRDVSMTLFRAGSGKVAEGVLRDGGHYAFAYPEPGRYMVLATWRRADPKRPEQWLVDTSTLTFDVR